MLLTEFDEKKYQEYLIKEAREEGIQIGIKKERKTSERAIKTMYTLGISTDVIAEKMQMTEKEVTRIIENK